MSQNELSVSQLAAALELPEERIQAMLADHGIQAEGGVPVWHGDLLDLLAADLAQPQIRERSNGRIFASMPDGAGEEIELCDVATLVDTYGVCESEIEGALAGYSTTVNGYYDLGVLPILDAAFLPSFGGDNE